MAFLFVASICEFSSTFHCVFWVNKQRKFERKFEERLTMKCWWSGASEAGDWCSFFFYKEVWDWEHTAIPHQLHLINFLKKKWIEFFVQFLAFRYIRIVFWTICRGIVNWFSFWFHFHCNLKKTWPRNSSFKGTEKSLFLSLLGELLRTLTSLPCLIFVPQAHFREIWKLFWKNLRLYYVMEADIHRHWTFTTVGGLGSERQTIPWLLPVDLHFCSVRRTIGKIHSGNC